MFQQTIATQKIEIKAPLEHVWNILVDLEKYGEWNPFTPRMESTLIVGEPIIIHVQMNARRRSVEKELVTQFQLHRRVAWRGTYPQFLWNSEHIQDLEPLANGNCTYYSYETFRGLASPLLMVAFKSDIQQGFDNVSLALKRRAEAGK